MDKPAILHILSPLPHVSPFDITMAYDAGFDAVVPYPNVTLEQIPGLVQDAIFPRSPERFETKRDPGRRPRRGHRDGHGRCGEGRDGASIRGLDPGRSKRRLYHCGGGRRLRRAPAAKHHQKELKEVWVVIFGGTGPIGVATGVIASLAGATATLVDYLSIDVAMSKANEYNRRCGTSLRGVYGCSDADNARIVSTQDVVICTAKAGVQVLSALGPGGRPSC